MAKPIGLRKALTVSPVNLAEEVSDLSKIPVSAVGHVSEVTEVLSPTPPPVNPLEDALGLPKKAGARMAAWPKMTEVPSPTHNAPTGTNFHEALRKSKTNNDAEC